jgi:zinc protease
VVAFNYASELASEFYILIDANAGEDLDALPAALKTAFQRFEENGISQADLDRIKASYEVQFYGQLENALGKAIALGQYNALAGDPDRINSDIRRVQAVTTEDIMRVYDTYIKDRPHISTSIVPKGEPELALTDSEQAAVVEEAIVQGAEAGGEESQQVNEYERTPSSFDRTVEPPFGKPYVLPTPDVWQGKMPAAIAAMSINPPSPV